MKEAGLMACLLNHRNSMKKMVTSQRAVAQSHFFNQMLIKKSTLRQKLCYAEPKTLVNRLQ